MREPPGRPRPSPFIRQSDLRQIKANQRPGIGSTAMRTIEPCLYLALLSEDRESSLRPTVSATTRTEA